MWSHPTRGLGAPARECRAQQISVLWGHLTLGSSSSEPGEGPDSSALYTDSLPDASFSLECFLDSRSEPQGPGPLLLSEMKKVGTP